MKERPILFSGPMVRAILAGTKTQTRRLVREELPSDASPYWNDLLDEWRWMSESGASGGLLRCAYGVSGDQLWVRETWQPFFKDGCIYLADAGTHRLNSPSEEHARAAWPGWKPSIFMPRKFSRITLEVTVVRVQRLQELSEEDAKAEGIGPCGCSGDVAEFIGCQQRQHHHGFAAGWDSINGKRAPWASNPWVWAISFRRVEHLNVYRAVRQLERMLPKAGIS